MNELELFRKIHNEILDYVDDQLLLKSANWGYKVHQTLLKHNLYLGCIEPEERGGEQSSPFIYAVATAVIVGEFGKQVYGDYFSTETNLIISELGLDFDEVRGFINKDIGKKRLELLKNVEGLGLEDIWEAICEWKRDIYNSLVSIYKQRGEKEPDNIIFQSLLDVFELTDEDDVQYLNLTPAQELSAYTYISNGFQY